MTITEFKLKERIKELNCLYELSKVAWAAENNVPKIIEQTIKILPVAMQYPEIAEARITIDKKTYTSPKFGKCKYFVSAVLMLHKRKCGSVEVGYRVTGKGEKKPAFLPEERNLINAVSRELSLIIERARGESEKEKLQIQLQHAERLAFVGELSAGIAHELNEPLSRILGFAQLIRKGGNLNNQQAQDMERIIKASLYTREIIKKLMIFSRQMPRQITTVNLNQVVKDILYFIDVRFQSRGTKIKTRLSDNLKLIQADEVQISQILVNLVTNSVHAMVEGGLITIYTRNKGTSVVFGVTDTGVGMSDEVKQKIFEPFFTTKPVGQGTGLGLSVVHAIVKAHNGKVSVTSSIGKGTTIEIQLPQKQLK